MRLALTGPQWRWDLKFEGVRHVRVVEACDALRATGKVSYSWNHNVGLTKVALIG